MLASNQDLHGVEAAAPEFTPIAFHHKFSSPCLRLTRQPQIVALLQTAGLLNSKHLGFLHVQTKTKYQSTPNNLAGIFQMNLTVFLSFV